MNLRIKLLFATVISAATLTAYSCGTQRGKAGRDGVSTVFQVLKTSQCSNGGSTIIMANDTNFNLILDTKDSNIRSAEICNGSNGSDGANGDNGSDGKDGTDGVAGANGDNGSDGANGSDGTDGANGNDGSNGTDGVAGSDGKDGTSPDLDFLPVAIIDPCGDAAGIDDEVLLRLGNGTILASISDKKNGENTRLSIIKPGSYMTTDGSSCTFTVHPDQSVTPL